MSCIIKNVIKADSNDVNDEGVNGRDILNT